MEKSEERAEWFPVIARLQLIDEELRKALRDEEDAEVVSVFHVPATPGAPGPNKESILVHTWVVAIVRRRPL